MGRTGADVPLVVLADGTESHQKELRELRAAAQTVVESMGSAEDSEGSLADQLRMVPRKFAEYLLRLLGTVWRKLLGLLSHTGLSQK